LAIKCIAYFLNSAALPNFSPINGNFSVFATTPCRGLSLSR
jgi:hypothetical protein